MSKTVSLPTVVESIKVTYDFNHWNSLQNTYELKVIDRHHKYPKWLLIRASQWFIEECKALHINPQPYQFVEITFDDPTWTVEFYDQEDRKGAHLVLSPIYYDSRGKRILQATFFIG